MEVEYVVNYVDPGNMNTAMHRAAEPDENPLQWADPAEVTEVFVYLASDESNNVNGKRFRAQGDNDNDNYIKQPALTAGLKKGKEDADSAAFDPFIEQQLHKQQHNHSIIS